MTNPNSQLRPIALTLRAEGLAIGISAIVAFAQTGASWLLFGLLILSPDLAMLGYLVGKRAGAICYNVAHSYLGPVLLFGAALIWAVPLATQVALIWTAHIGLDRALGYGLKYPTAFRDTHLARV